MRNPNGGDREVAGLCADCRHARITRNRRGSAFFRCGLADSDPRFRRYPQLPVRECAGHENGPQGGS
ncbi:MAG: hypothetical protein HKP27_00965 [Myxococcales bacterium]|nr:hypothetical protein [Myxococcales bacterium]